MNFLESHDSFNQFHEAIKSVFCLYNYLFVMIHKIPPKVIIWQRK